MKRSPNPFSWESSSIKWLLTNRPFSVQIEDLLLKVMERDSKVLIDLISKDLECNFFYSEKNRETLLFCCIKCHSGKKIGQFCAKITLNVTKLSDKVTYRFFIHDKHYHFPEERMSKFGTYNQVNTCHELKKEGEMKIFKKQPGNNISQTMNFNQRVVRHSSAGLSQRMMQPGHFDINTAIEMVEIDLEENKRYIGRDNNLLMLETDLPEFGMKMETPIPLPTIDKTEESALLQSTSESYSSFEKQEFSEGGLSVCENPNKSSKLANQHPSKISRLSDILSPTVVVSLTFSFLYFIYSIGKVICTIIDNNGLNSTLMYLDIGLYVISYGVVCFELYSLCISRTSKKPGFSGSNVISLSNAFVVFILSSLRLIKLLLSFFFEMVFFASETVKMVFYIISLVFNLYFALLLLLVIVLVFSMEIISRFKKKTDTADLHFRIIAYYPV